MSNHTSVRTSARMSAHTSAQAHARVRARISCTGLYQSLIFCFIAVIWPGLTSRLIASYTCSTFVFCSICGSPDARSKKTIHAHGYTCPYKWASPVYTYVHTHA